jgi:hypothetical protein
VNDTPSLVDRFFWPAVIMATLVLGGFVTVVYKTVTRTSTSIAAVNALPAEPEKIAPAKVLEVSLPAPEPIKSETTAVVAALKFQSEFAVPEVASAKADFEIAPQPKQKSSDDDSPYVVPSNKPFISSSDFGAPKAQPQPKKPLKPAPPVPAPSAVATPKTVTPPAMVKPVPPVVSKPLSALPVPHTPIYVLKDGRKIPAIKVVDLGESYGLKSASGQIVTVLKDDVINIEK